MWQERLLRHLYIGLDLGKRRDYSALAILEHSRVCYTRTNAITQAIENEYEQPRFAIRGLQRIPLETLYVEVVSRVRQKIELALARDCDCTLIVDATGVGQPVVEMFRDLPPRATLAPVVITSGDTETKAKDEWRVPKNDLIAGLQVMLETGTLKIAAGLEHADALMEELIEFRATDTGKGNEVYSGPKDDLVLAVALAVWRARQHEIPLPSKTNGFQNKDIGIHAVSTTPFGWGKVSLF